VGTKATTAAAATILFRPDRFDNICMVIEPVVSASKSLLLRLSLSRCLSVMCFTNSQSAVL
jgi:hypothetical protein